MLEGLVAWVLNNYLGQYVENLNTDQLSIAMLSGKVELENLPLKKDALRHLGIPVQVNAGFIGKVKLQIPVRQIRSAPWVIAIEKLYLVASPVNLSEWDSVDEMNVAQDLKLSILDALEAQWRAENEAHLDSSYYAASYSSWLSYGTSFVTNIVENLQLQLNDVHIRYEDAITCGERNAFACGLTVESLSAESCDCNWQKGFTLFSSDSEGCSFKLLELQKLAIYWDPLPMPIGLLANYTLSELAIRMAQTWHSNHIYIVSPSTAIAYLKRERCEQPLRSKNRPRINCNLTLDQVLLNLTDRQYNQMVGCMQGLTLIGKLRVFRQWRPSVPVTSDAKAWWKYAIKCHYPDHNWMEATPTWDSCLQQAKQMKQYVSICLMNLTNPAATLTTEHKSMKHEFEWCRPLQILKPLREAAMRKVPKASSNLSAEDSNAAGRTMLVRWFPQWWGWYGSAPATTDKDNLSQTVEGQAQNNSSTANQKNNLEEEILDVLADSIENNSLLRRDTVFGHFDFTLNKGSFNLSIVNSTDNDENIDHNSSSMLELQFSRLCVGVESRPRAGSHAVSVALGEVCLRDHITPNTLFPVLIAPQGTIRDGLSSMNVASNVMSWYKSQSSGSGAHAPTATNEPLFQLTYERKPFHKNCDYMLYVKSQSLEVVYNYNTVKWLMDFLSHPFSLNNGRVLVAPAYANMRNTTKMHLINKWEHILQGDLSEREMWQIELDISAPQIMFVEDFVDKNGVVVVVDFGRMQLTNGQPELGNVYDESAADEEDFEMFMTPCSTPPGSEISDGVNLSSAATSPLPGHALEPPDAINADTLHLRLYDRYKIELSDLQILVGRARDNWKYAHTKGSSSLHLLDRFNISLQAERRVVYTSDPQFPSATLSGTLPNLVVHLNEHKLAAVKSILNQINAPQHSPTGEVSGTDVTDSEMWKMESGWDETCSEHSDADQTERSCNQLSKLLMVQFAIDQMALEVQSRGRSIVEVQVCGVRVAFTKRPADYSLSLSVHSLLLVDALQTYGPDFELLVASHKHVGMDSVSGSIRDSEPTSPTSPASPTGRPPAAPPAPAALSQALYSLHSLHKPAAVAAAASLGPGCASPVLNLPGVVDSEALIVVEVTVVHAQAGREDLRIANILFNNLDIIANQETIVELIGFTQRVLSPKTGTTRKVTSEAKQAEPAAFMQRGAEAEAAAEAEARSPVRTEVTFDFHRLSVLLLRASMQDGGAGVEAKKIATATMSEAKIQATIGNKSLEVKGSLGGLQVVSLCPGSSVHQRMVSVGQHSLQPHTHQHTRLLSDLAQQLYKGLSTGSLDSDEEKAFIFNIKRTVEHPPMTGTQKEDAFSEIVNASVCVHMASVWYTHSGLFISELQSCVTEFKQYLSNLARSIKAAAADMAIGFVQPRAEGLYSSAKFSSSMEGVSPRRPRTVSLGYSLDADSAADCFKSQLNFSLDVELETPVVVLPRSCSSPQVFVAHLGKIFISNRPGPEHHYHLQVRDISLYSLDIASRLNKYHISADNMQSIYNAGKEGKPVLHNTTLHITLESLDIPHHHQTNCQRTIKIIGKIVTPLRVSATRNQYEQLLETVKTLSGSPVVQDTASRSKQDVCDVTHTANVPGTTLSINPHVLAATHPLMQPAALTEASAFAGHYATPSSLAHIEVNFQLPFITVELRGDFGNGERSLVDLSFRDFSVNYDKCENYETNIQVSLHSITMEDLTQEVESKYRLMMVSHTPHIPKAVFVSHSCPDFMTEYNECCASGTATSLLHHTGRGSLPNHLNLLTEGRDANKTDELKNCGRTPPSSPYFTSYNVVDEQNENKSMSADDNLVLISVQIRDPKHPLFEEKYSSVEKFTKVDFNCLNLVVSIDSWVAVLDFFGIVSDNESENLDTSTASEDVPAQNEADGILGITETEMSIRSLSIVLLGHYGRGEVCRANISRLALRLWAHGARAQRAVTGSLGSISLADLTTHATVWRERFMTSGKEALNFNYKRLSPEEAVVAECDTTLSLEMSSIRYVHTKRFVAEIQAFFREFSQLQRVLTQARHKVSVASMSSRSNKMRLSMECWSPVILVPVSGSSNLALVIDLGLLSVKNSFMKAGSPGTISSIRQFDNPIREMLDVRIIQLENMDLYCAERHSSGDLVLGSTRVRKCGPSLLTDKCHLVLQIENNLESYHNVADTSIHGTLNTLECALDPEQYKLIRGLLSYNLGENVDELCTSGELVSTPSSLAVCEGAGAIAVWTLSSLRLDLLNVIVRLETEHGASSLASINFIKSKLLVETFSDLTQDIDLVSQEILVSDTRYQSEPVNKRSNVFTNIVQPISESSKDSNEDGNGIYSVQAEVHARKRRDHSAYTILVNNMRLMAVLDWWNSVHQFIMQPPAPHSDPLVFKYNLHETREQTDGKCSPQTPMEQIELKLNITESQVVLVEDTSMWDTNAVILKSTTVISYRPGSDFKPVSCVLNHCEVFSCVIGMEDETALSIIDPVTVHIDIDADNVLQFQVSTLDVRLSYHDVRMFAGMLHSLPAQVQARPAAPANLASSRLAALGFSSRDTATALTLCKGNIDEAAIWLTQHATGHTAATTATAVTTAITASTNKLAQVDKKSSLWPLKRLQVRADCITICVIDDCLDSDVPLLEVSLSELWVSQDLRWGVEPSMVGTPQSPPLVPPTPISPVSLDSVAGVMTDAGGTGPGAGRLKCVLSSDYYNRGLSGWEPVIEPWKCEASWEYTLTSMLNRNRLQLEVNSTEVLNLSVTSSLMELYSLVKTNWTQDYYAVPSRGEMSPKSSPAGYRRRSPFVPFALSNQTGIKLWFTTFITNSDVIGESSQVSELDESWTCVKAGETSPFAFGSVRGRGRRRGGGAWHQLGVRLEGWGAIGPVCVDKIGVFFRHAIHVKTDLEARVVFSVTLEGSARKLITVRSALQLVNELPQPIEVRIDNSASGTQWGMLLWSSRCVQVDSGATWDAPLAPAPQPLWVRPLCADSAPPAARPPAFMYCLAPLDWRAAARRLAHEPPLLMHNVCHSSADQVYRFGCILRREKYPADRGLPIPGHTFILRPALRLVNLLPVDLQYSINSTQQGSILPGETEPFHQVNVEDTVEISFKLDGFANSTFLTILPTATTSFSTKVKLIDAKNRRLYLNAHISIKRTDTVKISISSPYWIVNRTGIPIVFRQEGIVSETAGQYEEHEIARMVAPLLFSFAESEGSPTLVARVGTAVEGHSQWCSSFSLGPGILVRRLSMKAPRGSADKVFLVGVLVRPGRGRYRHTNICTISPRYQIHNNTSYHLQFAQKCYATMLADPAASASHVSAVSGCYMPFHWSRQEREQLLCVRPLDVANCHWSGGFRIDTNNSMHIGCRDPYGSFYFLRLEVVLQGATFFVVFTDADTMPPSIRIENFSPVSISFHQVACKEEVTIKPHGSSAWALSEPCGASAVVLAAPGGNRATLDLQVLGKGQTITYQNFIYIAFTGTHASGLISDTKGLAATVEESQLVFEVPVGSHRVMLGRKRFGDRSQLWRRGPNNQLVHEGSSPPQAINITSREEVTMSPHSMVLDIESAAPRPGTPANLCLRRPDARRVSTQAWRFTPDGRMCCAHSNMCVQPADGFFGLRPGNRVILGLPDLMSPCLLSSHLPIEQAVSAHALRPGSGYLNVSVCADGPTRVIEIHDAKNREKGWCEGDHVNRTYNPVAGTDNEFELRVALGGLGLSIVSKKPAEELIYAMFSGILSEIGWSSRSKSLNLSVQDVQFDNQVLGALSPVVVWMTRARSIAAPPALPALQMSAALTPSHPARNYNALIFRHLIISLRPVSVRLEERLLLKLYVWLGRDAEAARASEEPDETDFETQRLLTEVTAVHATRYYFGVFRIIPSQIRLSMQTASKLEPRLALIKRKLRLKLIKFEDAGVELEPFERWHPFETSQFLWHTIIKHFKDELKWQAAKILVSVDFLGNPLGFMQDVSEGVSGLLYEGNVGALVKNVTHGISNSAAKMTESLGDGLECVVVDKAHEETRRRIRSAGAGHLVAGFRGLGLGLLGGMTSLVKHSYEGATQEGIPGFLTGVGKGLMGTVTKPVIGVLDLAAETASAIRETSRRSDKWVPERMRLARCAAGRGGLLPRYSLSAAAGLRFLHTVNGDDHNEGFIAYEACRDAPHDIRALLSTQHLRIFTCRAGAPQIVLEMHLSNLICCSAVSECSEHYVELVGRVGGDGGSGSGGVRRPRVQCDTPALARAVAAHANYAKRLFHDTLHTLPPVTDTDTYD